MSLKNLAQIALALLLIGTVWIGAGSAARAQQAGPNNFDFDKVEVREALRQIFKSVNVSYSISPQVQGTITVSLHNVTFETALQNILRQIDATYRIEAGVYEILPKVITVEPEPKDRALFATPPGGDFAMVQDGNYLYIVREDQLYKVRKSDLKVAQTGFLPPTTIKFRT